MSILDSLRNLTRPYDDEDDEEYYDDEYAPEPQRPAAQQQPRPAERPARQSPPPQAAPPKQTAYPQDREQRRGGMPVREVVNIGGANGGMALVLVKPERFEQAAEIADHIRDRHAVVMNLEQAQKDVSRRLIDFLSGVAYAQDGKIKKAANATYIITPYNVDLMGDLMDELESGGLYF